MRTVIQYTEFAKEVHAGLSSERKCLSSKYFYDDNGSAIFRQIMTLPEYYPTRCEREILENHANAILHILDFASGFNVVELGSGDGTKTIKLLQSFLANDADFTYIPVDISQEALSELEKNIKQSMPGLPIEPLAGDYFEVLTKLASGKKSALFIFLGGNIGNYQDPEAQALLMKFGEQMKRGDKLLIGIDLVKNPKIIQKAYDDSQGITKAFNMNLLQRMNAELEMDFVLAAFDFYSFYNPENGEVRSYLVSVKKQTVRSRVTDEVYRFAEGETIWTELSKKYTFTQIENLASSSGFKVLRNFTDSKDYFCDSLWIK